MTKQLPLAAAIQWYEGMLLSPQHFQQQELRWNQTLTHHLTHLSNHHWGIIKLTFDPVTLPTGIYRILELKAIMPDGLIVDYKATPNSKQLEVDLTPHKTLLQSAHTTIHLCVPEYISGASPVIGEWPRYDSIEGEDIPDDNAQDNVIQIPRLLPKLSLQIGNLPPARFLTFPLVKIGVQEESFILKSFIPPCFQTPQSSPLGEKCGQLARRIREKASFLSEKWQTLIGTPLLAESSAQLRPLVQSLPIMEPLILSGTAHPYEIYQQLSHVAGLLSTLRLGQIPPIFPPYNHNDILGSINPLFDWCQTIVDSLEKAYSLVLFVRREHLFSVMLQPEIFTKKILIGIKAPATMSEGELEDWMKDTMIVSESMIESAQLRRITGAPRHVVTHSELYDLMPGRGVLIFSVEADSHFIKQGERLIVSNPADSEDKRPTEIVLYLKHSEISGDVIDHLEEDE